MTDGLQKRDYLYIDDLVKIITKLVTIAINQTYNIKRANQKNYNC